MENLCGCEMVREEGLVGAYEAGHGRIHPNSGFLTIILRYAVLQSLDVPYTTPTGGKLATVTVVVECIRLGDSPPSDI